MKRGVRFLVVLSVSIAVVAGVAALGSGSRAVAAAGTAKTVEMTCGNGWRASAGGVYGGVSFSIDCSFDKRSVVIEDTVGTAYSIRGGAQSLEGAVDCFYSGDDRTVRERCGEVRPTIR